MYGYEFDPPTRALVKELEAMQEGFGKKGIRAGLVYAIKPLKSALKTVAPERSGALKKAIGHNQLSRRAKGRLGVPDDQVALLVGANRKVAVGESGRKVWQGMKAHWLEVGTKHMAARPWIAPTISAMDGQTNSRFYQGLYNYVERQRAKRRT